MSCSLTRSRCRALLLALILTACTSQAPVEVVEVNTLSEPTRLEPQPVKDWLRWQETVSTMESSQLTTSLEAMAKPGNVNQMYYYALLNQQSDSYESWVIARDIFRQLHEKHALTPEQRRLASLLERYNQNRINGFHSHDDMQQQYDKIQREMTDLKAQNQALREKIQAITDLESTMSTRSEN